MRTLRALGPVSLSTAEAAMGWIICFSSCEDKAFIGAASSAHNLCNLSGSFFDGNESLGTTSEPVSAASSFWNPASSRAPRPRVVRMDARWPME